MQKGRTENKWESKYRKDWIKKLFSPRLAKDLRQLPAPESFPALDLAEGESLFLFGSVETGKTVYIAQLALDIKKRLWLKGEHKSIEFVSVPDIFSKLKGSFNTKDAQESDIISHYQQVDILILDDLGLGSKIGDWMINVLYLIINYRYEQLQPTLITSNKSLGQLSELFGDTRVTSRIKRMGRVMRKNPYDEDS